MPRSSSLELSPLPALIFTLRVLTRLPICLRSSSRAYGLLVDNVLNKLTRRLPTMPPEVAGLVSLYLSALSQHRDLAKAARPDGFTNS